MDEVEKRTSQANHSLHMNAPKNHSPLRSCAAFKVIAVMATARSAIASDARKMLFVIWRYEYFFIAIMTRIFPVKNERINQ